MGKVFIMFIMFLFSCNKQDGVMMKYVYITKDNIEYKQEHGYGMVTTHLCPYESRLSSRELVIEQDRQRVLIEAVGKLVLVDTLVGVDVDVTKDLFSKL